MSNQWFERWTWMILYEFLSRFWANPIGVLRLLGGAPHSTVPFKSGRPWDVGEKRLANLRAVPSRPEQRISSTQLRMWGMWFYEQQRVKDSVNMSGKSTWGKIGSWNLFRQFHGKINSSAQICGYIGHEIVAALSRQVAFICSWSFMGDSLRACNTSSINLKDDHGTCCLPKNRTSGRSKNDGEQWRVSMVQNGQKLVGPLVHLLTSRSGRWSVKKMQVPC